MNNINKTGPKLVPCVTPQVKLYHLEIKRTASSLFNQILTEPFLLEVQNIYNQQRPYLMFY